MDTQVLKEPLATLALKVYQDTPESKEFRVTAELALQDIRVSQDIVAGLVTLVSKAHPDTQVSLVNLATQVLKVLPGLAGTQGLLVQAAIPVVQGILGKVVPQVIQALKVSPDTQASLANLDIQDILGPKE